MSTTMTTAVIITTTLWLRRSLICPCCHVFSTATDATTRNLVVAGIVVVEERSRNSRSPRVAGDNLGDGGRRRRRRRRREEESATGKGRTRTTSCAVSVTIRDRLILELASLLSPSLTMILYFL